MMRTSPRHTSRTFPFLLLALISLTLVSTNVFAGPPRAKVSLLGVPFISTLTGQGWDDGGYTGDGGPASAATLYYPYGITTDNAGNVYIADSDNYVVRVVNTQATAITVAGVSIQPGNIATVAGNGTEGYSGDGGPATSAQLGWIYSVAVDPAGNIYVPDEYANVVRKIGTDGTISRFAGVVSEGCTEGQSAGDGGPALSATFDCIWSASADAAGNIYIGDSWAGLIRVVNTQATAITVAGITIQPGNIATVAGTPQNQNYGCDGDVSAGDGGPAPAPRLLASLR